MSGWDDDFWLDDEIQREREHNEERGLSEYLQERERDEDERHLRRLP